MQLLVLLRKRNILIHELIFSVLFLVVRKNAKIAMNVRKTFVWCFFFVLKTTARKEWRR